MCETTLVKEHYCVIVGIGLNVNMPLSVIESIDQPATSLFVESETRWDLAEIHINLQMIFKEHLMQFLKNDFDAFREKYCIAVSGSFGKEISVKDSSGIVEGIFHSINSDGSLLLLLPNGQTKNLYSGQVVINS